MIYFKSMRKFILFFLLYFLCLLFNGFAFAELSDQQKQDFIESLAEPLKEKRVFYLWHTKANNRTLLKAGKMTSKIHQSFMIERSNQPFYEGLHVAEDISSSSAYGNNLIQVEVDPGYRFLHTSNEARIKLREQEIPEKDVYRLGSQIAIPYFFISDRLISDLVNSLISLIPDNFRSPDLLLTSAPISSNWWILKAREGIKFQPFSSDGISLKDLEEAYERLEETAPKHYSGPFSFFDKPFNLSKKRRYFEDLIREDILNRAEESVAVFRSSFIKIVEEEHGKEYVADRVHHHSRHIKSLDEAARWFKYAGNYLSEADKKRIVERTKQLPIRAMDYDGDFVSSAKKFFFDLKQIKDYLSDSEYEEFYKKFHAREQISVTKNADEGICVSSFAD